MIEVIYKDEKREENDSGKIFDVPKNIRQIGQVSEDYRIYMEDYVYTFLKKTADKLQEAPDRCCLAVFTGQGKWADGVNYIFIKGALAVEDEEISAEHIDFGDGVWRKVQEEAEKYYSGQEILGWFLASHSLKMEATDVLRRIHLKYFGGGEKVLMLMDPSEKEEAFFRCENNFLVKQNGYYLYYEKNPRMQAYMMEKNPDIAGEEGEAAKDDAVKAFRAIINKKKETEETEDKVSVFSYAATACLALAVAAAGMHFYQNYQDMQAQDIKTEAVSSVINEREETPAAENKAQHMENLSAGADENETEDEKNKADAKETQETKTAEEDGSESGTETENRGEGDGDHETLSPEDEAIYREESDVRKAERRVQEAREQQGTDEESAEETTEQETAASSGTSYIIRPGDTLYQISLEQYGTMDKIEEICRLNSIEEDEIIYPGQIIVLP